MQPWGVFEGQLEVVYVLLASEGGVLVLPSSNQITHAKDDHILSTTVSRMQ
jgi:hypothetical protein